VRLTGVTLSPAGALLQVVSEFVPLSHYLVLDTHRHAFGTEHRLPTTYGRTEGSLWF